MEETVHHNTGFPDKSPEEVITPLAPTMIDAPSDSPHWHGSTRNNSTECLTVKAHDPRCCLVLPLAMSSFSCNDYWWNELATPSSHVGFSHLIPAPNVGQKRPGFARSYKFLFSRRRLQSDQRSTLLYSFYSTENCKWTVNQRWVNQTVRHASQSMFESKLTLVI